MDSNGLMVVATTRGEYGGIWRESNKMFSISNPGERARWMRPADPNDPRWVVPAVDECPAPADAGASDTARLSRIEAKLDWIIDRVRGGESAPVDGPPAVAAGVSGAANSAS